MTSVAPEVNDIVHGRLGDDQLQTNVYIQMIALIPFSILLLALCIVLRKRRIDDYYLKRSIVFLVVAIAIRITMCFILFVIVVVNWDSDSWRLLELKIEVLEFSVPYYLFFMVLLSLFFSAHTFYIGLRNILFPQIQESDDNFRPVKLNKLCYVSTRTRFRVLLYLICATVAVLAIIILCTHDYIVNEKIFVKPALAFLYFGDALLYCIQVFALIFALVLLCRLRNLINTRPDPSCFGQDDQQNEEYK